MTKVMCYIPIHRNDGKERRRMRYDKGRKLESTTSQIHGVCFSPLSNQNTDTGKNIDAIYSGSNTVFSRDFQMGQDQCE